MKAKLGFMAPPVVCAAMAFEEILVDARGHRCPVPTLRLRRALEDAPSGATVRLLADDPLARIDVPHFAGEAGFTVVDQGEDAGVLTFVVSKP
jgi:tRNA 2-thiouridine synthesizing protein A